MADDALMGRVDADGPRSDRPRPLPGRQIQWAVRSGRRALRERRLGPVVRDGRVDLGALLESARADRRAQATQLRRALSAAGLGDDAAAVTAAALVLAVADDDGPRINGLVQFLERSFERHELDAATACLQRLDAFPAGLRSAAAVGWDGLRSGCLGVATRAQAPAPTRTHEDGRPTAAPVVLRLSGGLGNQMFQYAAASAYAHRLGVPLRLDLEEYEIPGAYRDFLLGRLAVPVERAGWLDILRARRRPHLERRGIPDDALLQGTHGRWLVGQWEHPKYFEGVREALMPRFRPRDPEVLRRAAEVVAAARVDGGPVVGIHVRRGDRAPGGTFGAPLATLPASYYGDAVAGFPAPATFMLFSDSPLDAESSGWTSGLEGRLSVSSSVDPVADLFTLANCDHVVLSAGTFSWWAAYLGERPGRRVIAPDVVQAMSAMRVIWPPSPPIMPGWTELPIRDWRPG